MIFDFNEFNAHQALTQFNEKFCLVSLTTTH
jgi:hypothetical protein